MRRYVEICETYVDLFYFVGYFMWSKYNTIKRRKKYELQTNKRA